MIASNLRFTIIITITLHRLAFDLTIPFILL